MVPKVYVTNVRLGVQRVLKLCLLILELVYGAGHIIVGGNRAAPGGTKDKPHAVRTSVIKCFNFA